MLWFGPWGHQQSGYFWLISHLVFGKYRTHQQYHRKAVRVGLIAAVEVDTRQFGLSPHPEAIIFNLFALAN